MNLTVGFVSRNVVTQMDFVELQDSRIFHKFRGNNCPVKPKNEILGNNLSKVHLK